MPNKTLQTTEYKEFIQNIKYMRKWYLYYLNSPQAVDFFVNNEKR